ncbi:uncharacterized protein PAE49_021776 [Odontesthes bonariensis]
MAATASHRRRATVGLSRTKGLFMIFTLLNLACAVSSLIDEDQQKELKENIQKLQLEAVRKRADNMLDSIFISDLMEEAVHLMDYSTETLKRAIPDFPPVLSLMGDLKTFLEACKVYTDKELEKKAAKLKDNEEKLKQVEKLISNLAGQKADL